MVRRLDRNTLLAFAGLLVGIAGLLVQWVADPAKFSAAQGFFGLAFPPGILFIVLAGLLMLATARWWWHPVFGVFIAFWIVGVGTIAGQLTPNLVSADPGTVAGNVVMSAGLLLTFVAGIAAMISGRRLVRS
jgi:hypothetical protein